MGKAKGGSIFIRLVSPAATGFVYVKRKNSTKLKEKPSGESPCSIHRDQNEVVSIILVADQDILYHVFFQLLRLFCHRLTLDFTDSKIQNFRKFSMVMADICFFQLEIGALTMN